MSAVLAGPPGECCRQTVHHVGEARGKVEIVAGVETYIARPADGSNKKIVLFFADVYSPLYLNSQLIMDFWADQGYLVVGLDYFERDSMILHSGEEVFDFMKWVKPKQDRAQALIGPWVEAVRKDFGYCFGAPYVMEHLAQDWLVAGAFAHPAFLNEDHFRNIRKPLLMSCAEIDHTFGLEARRKAEDILVETRATYFIQVFGSVQHGFALRGDPKIPVQRWAKEESARSIVNWFEHFCR
ncbi:alpha/beta-hydrolase [Epithele typhae]|uniref:alpha/beta-hydrolase n=1 Tax=Epithele typhae TaxID=378194 RepID=UPI0020080370|nr:alpha/beta-hydrolase [Epithele typhae]KAH9923208.1 alpha/beta-hydrolase [Epithele typhae]